MRSPAQMQRQIFKGDLIGDGVEIRQGWLRPDTSTIVQGVLWLNVAATRPSATAILPAQHPQDGIRCCWSSKVSTSTRYALGRPCWVSGWASCLARYAEFVACRSTWLRFGSHEVILKCPLARKESPKSRRLVIQTPIRRSMLRTCRKAPRTLVFKVHAFVDRARSASIIPEGASSAFEANARGISRLSICQCSKSISRARWATCFGGSEIAAMSLPHSLCGLLHGAT